MTGVVQQLLSVVTTIGLARLLTPAQFGLAAIANTLVLFGSLLGAVGFGQALVKQRELDQRVIATIFWSATGLGVVVAGTIAALSGVLAHAAGQPGATRYVLILAPTMVLGAASSIPRALLQRTLRFRAMYGVDLSSAVVYTATQLGLAAAGRGASAIVLGQLAASATALLWALFAARWRPVLAFDVGVLKANARFGGGTLANTALSYVIKNADNLVVARTGSAALVGVYYVAYVLPNILRQRLTWMATDVLLPVFARMRDDAERSRRAYRRSLGLHALAGFPTMAGIAATAPHIVGVAFGERWAAAAAPLRFLALAALAEFVTQAATTVFIAHGVPGRNATLRLVSLAVLIPGLAIAAPTHRLVPVALAVLVATVAAAVVAQAFVIRMLGVTVRDIVAALAVVSVPTAAMAAAVVAVDHAVGGGARSVPTLVLLVVVGVLAYPAVGLVLLPGPTRELLREGRLLVVPGRGRRSAERAVVEREHPGDDPVEGEALGEQAPTLGDPREDVGSAG